MDGKVPVLNDAELRQIRGEYSEGCRVVLDKMEDPYVTIPVGTQGTVRGVDDAGSIMVNWDTGNSLSVLHGVDRCHLISSEEELLVTLNWYGKHQKGRNARCPRCGQIMQGCTARNALSRYAWIMVCSQCGMEEALEQAGLISVTEIKNWAAIRIPLSGEGAWEMENNCIEQ